MHNHRSFDCKSDSNVETALLRLGNNDVAVRIALPHSAVLVQQSRSSVQYVQGATHPWTQGIVIGVQQTHRISASINRSIDPDADQRRREARRCPEYRAHEKGALLVLRLISRSGRKLGGDPLTRITPAFLCCSGLVPDSFPVYEILHLQTSICNSHNVSKLVDIALVHTSRRSQKRRYTRRIVIMREPAGSVMSTCRTQPYIRPIISLRACNDCPAGVVARARLPSSTCGTAVT
jgi:hypothetical protein